MAKQMTNEEFFKARVAAGISSVELADFLGLMRKEMLEVETGKRPVAASMVAALNVLAAAT